MDHDLGAVLGSPPLPQLCIFRRHVALIAGRIVLVLGEALEMGEESTRGEKYEELEVV